MNERVTLTVPALQAYVLVIRTALGGLALVNDLDLDTLDDLRQAADEACDCLMHQGAPARSLRLEAWSEGGKLRVALQAELDGKGGESSPEELELSIESEDCDTISGYLIEQLGHIPQEGARERITIDNLAFLTEDVRDNRIASVRMKILPQISNDE